jgi:hypothetical protein
MANDEISFENQPDEEFQMSVISLTSELNTLSANHTDVNFDTLSSLISDFLQKIDSVNSSKKACIEELESVKNEVLMLHSKLEIEKENRRNEMNNSFKIMDETNDEIIDLKQRIQSLQGAVRERELQITALIGENNTLTDDLRSVRAQLEQSKLDYNNQSLNVKKLNCKLDVLKQEIVQNTKQRSSSSSKWVDEHNIAAYFNEMSNSVKTNKEILFFDPSVTQLIKLGSTEACSDILSRSSYDSSSFIFCCVNNSTETERADSGSHWSLLFIDRKNCIGYHFDSVKGVNKNSAVNILTKLKMPESSLYEINCPQQTNDFECGLHVIVNAKFILNYYCIPGRGDSFPNWFYCNTVNATHTVIPSPKLTASTVSPSNHSQLNPESSHPSNKTTVTSGKVDSVKLVRCSGSNDTWQIVKPKRTSDNVHRKTVSNDLNTSSVIKCSNKFSVLSDDETCSNNDVFFNNGSGSWKATKVKNRTQHRNNSPTSVSNRKTDLTVPSKPMNSVLKIAHKKTDHGDRDLVDKSKLSHCLLPNESQMGKCLVIGDSLLRHSGKQCSKAGVVVDVNPGAKTSSIKHKLLSYVNKKPESIYLNVGTNDVPLGYNGGAGYNGGGGKRAILDSMADLLYMIRTKFPNSKVFLNSIPIRRDINKKSLVQLNEQIELMCFNFGVHYVEVNECLRWYHLARDGRHLNRKGNYLLGFLIHQVLLNVCVPHPEMYPSNNAIPSAPTSGNDSVIPSKPTR